MLNNPAIELPLREIHLPDPIAWWPLAPGWWLVSGMFLLIIFLTTVLIKKCLKPTLRKEAAKALKEIENGFGESGDPLQTLSELSAFLRRVALSRENSSKTAGLTGVEWLEWLDRSLDKPEFSQGAGRILLTGPYQQHVEKESVSALLLLCHKWMKHL